VRHCFGRMAHGSLVHDFEIRLIRAGNVLTLTPC
jgi:hypothetical protein